MSDIARRVAFKYKEKKQNRADRLAKEIREKTGVSKSLADDVADAIVRGRDVKRLAMQKNWPLDENGHLEGPKGSVDLDELSQAQ